MCYHQDITKVLRTQWSAVWKIQNEVINGCNNATDCRQKQEAENLHKLSKIYSQQRKLTEPSVQELLFAHAQNMKKYPLPFLSVSG